MKPSYIIFGIVGVVVLYFISRMGSSASEGVEYVAAQSDDAQAQADAQTRLGALGMLASLAQGETEAQTARQGIAAQLSATQIAADLQRAGMAANERLGLRQIAAQEDIYLADLNSRVAQEQLHANTIINFIRENRGKISTQSSGVIFNALASAFGRQPTYSYESAFGPKQTPWYLPITQGIGKFISGFSNPFQSIGGGGA